MNDYVYNFPECKKRKGSKTQALHVLEEALEAVQALEESEPRFVEELLDCIHAIETELRNHDKWMVTAQYRGVIENNRKRGYYE